MRHRRHVVVVEDSESDVQTLAVVVKHRLTKRGWVTKTKVLPNIPDPVHHKPSKRQEEASKQRTQRKQQQQQQPEMEPQSAAVSSSPVTAVLRNYARLTDAFLASSSLPRTVYFSHTEHTLTIFDAYPKALFHFLVLPRLSKNTRRPSSSDLTNLRTLLRRCASTGSTDARVEETLRVLADEAARLRAVIEEEMLARYGFVWDVWVGFHAVPSMEHLHLHVISSDLTAPALKTKRHYNSFSPREGFFVPLAEVRSWFNAATGVPQQHYAKMRLAPEEYEPRLKNPLECFRCGQPAKSMPALKKHLQEEFDALRKRKVESKKRKREIVEAEVESTPDRETSAAAAQGKGKKVARLS